MIGSHTAKLGAFNKLGGFMLKTDKSWQDPGRLLESLFRPALASLTLAALFLVWQRSVGAADEGKPLRVRNLEIVDSAGVARMRLGAPVPDPATGGKTSPRRSPLNGIQINDAAGDEFGGLGMMDDGSMTFCFDSKTSEATCMYSLASGERGFSVTDDHGKDRTIMEIRQDKSISISINDENGKPAAVIHLPSGASPQIRLTSKDGKVLWSAPESNSQ